MTQPEIAQKVRDFYAEKNIDPAVPVDGFKVCARLVLFTEWLNKPKEEPKEETWEDIFKNQPN